MNAHTSKSHIVSSPGNPRNEKVASITRKAVEGRYDPVLRCSGFVSKESLIKLFEADSYNILHYHDEEKCPCGFLSSIQIVTAYAGPHLSALILHVGIPDLKLLNKYREFHHHIDLTVSLDIEDVNNIGGVPNLTKVFHEYKENRASIILEHLPEGL